MAFYCLLRFVCPAAQHKIARFCQKTFYSANFANIVSVIVLLVRFQAALGERRSANGYNDCWFTCFNIVE